MKASNKRNVAALAVAALGFGIVGPAMGDSISGTFSSPDYTAGHYADPTIDLSNFNGLVSSAIVKVAEPVAQAGGSNSPPGDIITSPVY